jgi:hypothetical protein
MAATVAPASEAPVRHLYRLCVVAVFFLHTNDIGTSRCCKPIHRPNYGRRILGSPTLNPKKDRTVALVVREPKLDSVPDLANEPKESDGPTAQNPNAILRDRSSGFARAIARPPRRSSLYVRDSRQLDRGRSCRGRNIGIPGGRSRGRSHLSRATSQTTQ